MGKEQRGDRPKAQGERGKCASRGLPLVCLPVFSLGLLLPAGCSGLSQAIGNDPLLGGPPLRPSAGIAPPAPAPLAALPPPAANSILSNAALAAGGPRPADSSPDLRIVSPRSGAANDGWGKQGSAGNNPDSGMGQMANGSGAILRPPEPVTDPTPRRELTAVSNPGSSHDAAPTPSSSPPGSVTTFEQAQRQMAARAPLWERLETAGENGEWKYSCSIPNRQNPRIRRTYEAKASDPVAAIRAVLEQLEKEQ